MGINVSTAMGFENREFLKNAAKEILQKGGAQPEKASEIAQKAVFSSDLGATSNLSVLTASTQITLNNSLRETLKYLQAHAKDKRKKYVLGDLWEMLGEAKFSGEENSYKGDLLDFEIDSNTKNIFAAA